MNEPVNLHKLTEKTDVSRVLFIILNSTLKNYPSQYIFHFLIFKLIICEV